MHNRFPSEVIGNPLIENGVLADAIDASGKVWPVQYTHLANGGHGHGVLMCAEDPFQPNLPVILAFGDVISGVAHGGTKEGFWSFMFQAIPRRDSKLHGTPEGSRELIELRVSLQSLQADSPLLKEVQELTVTAEAAMDALVTQSAASRETIGLFTLLRVKTGQVGNDHPRYPGLKTRAEDVVIRFGVWREAQVLHLGDHSGW